MNSTDVAKNGFKTFILTLSVSLIVFSTIYYIVTSRSSSEKFEASNSQAYVVGSSSSDGSDKADVKGASTAAADTSGASTFGQLAQAQPQAEPQVAKGVVLAGSTVNTTTTQTTQSTTIDTGVVEITAGLIISLALFLVGFYVVFLNPRKLALSSFERSVTKKL